MRISICLLLLGLLSLSAAAPASAVESSAEFDLRRAVPVDAHMAVHGRHNPERDYQQAYLADIWQVVQEERLPERIIEIFTSRIPEEELTGAKSVLEEVRKALEPIDIESLSACREVVYAQQMEVPFNHHLLLLRLTEVDAQAWETAFGNLLSLIEQRSRGKLSVQTNEQDRVPITSLKLPAKVPFSPSLARIGDILLFSDSKPLLQQSAAMLQAGNQESKFDDPRLIEALKELPEPEDCLVYVDGRLLFEKLGQLGEFIRTESHGNPKAARVSRLIDLWMNEMAVLDYAITVETTEGNQNRTIEVSKLLPGSREKLLGQLIAGGKPLDQWQHWIPADALAYSMSSGIDLHSIYLRLENIIRREIPESHEYLDQFEQLQEKLDVHLDRDILQSFSGACVSIRLPKEQASGGQTSGQGHDSVVALQCSNPERIRELLHRLVNVLNRHPSVQSQGLRLTESDQLEGFDQLQFAMLGMLGAQPVIGFQDGWMIAGTRAEAVRKVLVAREVKTAGIESSNRFKQFHLEIDGPVQTLSYSNLAESTQEAAQFLRQAGTIAPMVLGLIGAQNNPEAMQPIQEIFSLLPSVANVVEKFDYLQAKLSVTQPGKEPESIVARSVTIVRPPSAAQPAADGDQ